MATLPFEKLPLGFRFRPTDVELIDHYLRLKINGNERDVSVIKEVDVCKVEPWDLPDLSIIQTIDQEWFFFCPRDRKYPTGQRSNRATSKGYWKATGKDRRIVSRTMGLIGMKKTLVFYMGRAPKGKRTLWVIHEYRTTLEELDGTQPGQGAFVLCRLFNKQEDKKKTDEDECSNCDDVETIVCSQTAANSTSPGELQSDVALIQKSPLSCGKSVEDPGSTENKFDLVSQCLESNSLVPARTQSHSNSFNVRDEDVQFKLNSEIDDAVKYFYIPEAQLSPLHQMDLGPEIATVDQIDTCGFGSAAGEMQFQYGDNDKAISEFLNSVLNSDDYSGTWDSKIPFIEGSDCKSIDGVSFNNLVKKENGSYSGSDAEVTEFQYDVAFTNSSVFYQSSHDPMANVHLLQPHPYVDDNLFSDATLDKFCNAPSAEEGSTCTIQYSDPHQQDEMVDGKGDLGIQIRQRTEVHTSLPTNMVNQGTASRRIVLQKPLEDGEKSSPVSEESRVQPAPRRDRGKKWIGKARNKNADVQKGIKLFICSRRIKSIHMIGVALVMVMSLASICIWRAPLTIH